MLPPLAKVTCKSKMLLLCPKCAYTIAYRGDTKEQRVDIPPQSKILRPLLAFFSPRHGGICLEWGGRCGKPCKEDMAGATPCLSFPNANVCVSYTSRVGRPRERHLPCCLATQMPLLTAAQPLRFEGDGSPRALLFHTHERRQGAGVPQRDGGTNAGDTLATEHARLQHKHFASWLAVSAVLMVQTRSHKYRIRTQTHTRRTQTGSHLIPERLAAQ
jgi:hypothetical protein